MRIAALMLIASSVAAPASATEVVVNVSGVRNSTGQVGCALHASSSGFPTGTTGIAARFVKASPGSVVCRFTGVKPGTYAVAVAHDENSNRKTDANMLGIPTEAWGVSNNVRPSLRAPTFREAQFDVPASGATISVRVAR